MSLVIVERDFETPCDPAALLASEAAAAWCLQAHGVRRLRSLVARDRLRMVCFYEAPDAEAVRRTQRTAALPVTHAWTAVHLPSADGPGQQGHGTIIVQRALPSGITPEALREAMADRFGCGARLRAELVESHVSLEMTRCVCRFRAPDAEAVRIVNRELALPVEAVWPATELTAQATPGD